MPAEPRKAKYAFPASSVWWDPEHIHVLAASLPLGRNSPWEAERRVQPSPARLAALNEHFNLITAIK